MKKLILASTSTYRAQMLKRLRLPFTCVAPGVDESDCAHSGPARANHLATEKAKAVAAAHPDAVVIGSDQSAYCEADNLHKPGTDARARAQLGAISGKAVDFYTAVAVVTSGQVLAECDHTRVFMRPLSSEEIKVYVQLEQPLDCAGAFKSEGLGIALFERVESNDPTALIGLPLIQLVSLLRAVGVNVPGGGGTVHTDD